jgi:DNA-binding CsgD family transcriptional regulator
MARLSGSDYEAIVAIVAEASRGSPEEPLPYDVLESIRRLFPAVDVVAYSEGVPGDRLGRRVWISGAHPAWSQADLQLMDELRFQIPIWPSPRTAGQACRLTDLMTLRAYRRTDLYNLVGRPHRVEYTMDCWMQTPDGLIRGFSLDASERDPSERDRDVLDVLAHHLAVVLGRWDPRLPASAEGLGLTARQAEVLAWVARGRTNAEIASTLSLSPNTVRKHLENAFERLGVSNRAAAIAMAYEANLRPQGRPHA